MLLNAAVSEGCEERRAVDPDPGVEPSAKERAIDDVTNIMVEHERANVIAEAEREEAAEPR